MGLSDLAQKAAKVARFCFAYINPDFSSSRSSVKNRSFTGRFGCGHAALWPSMKKFFGESLAPKAFGLEAYRLSAICS
jgi:hypothetical protein